MKNLLYNCLSGTLELTDAFAGENNASQLIIDYTGTPCEDWVKWLDVRKSNGETGNVSLGTDVIVYQPIPNEWTEKGRLEINPYAIDGSGNVQRFPIKPISIKGALLVAHTTTDYTDSAIEVLQNLVSAIELHLEPKFNDIVFELTQTRQGANLKPDFDTTNIGLLFPQNNTAEIVYITVQLPHSWEEGTTIYPHIHVRQSANQQAVFKLDYIWYNAGDTIPTVWQTLTLNEYALPYTSGSISQIIKSTNGISGSGKLISSLLKIKLYRDDNVYTGDMLADQFDIHIEIDSYGSATQFSKV